MLNFYSIVSLKLLKKLSASLFYVAGMCAADTDIFCDVHYKHISFAVLLQNPHICYVVRHYSKAFEVFSLVVTALKIFPLKISSVNVTKSAGNSGFGYIH